MSHAAQNSESWRGVPEKNNSSTLIWRGRGRHLGVSAEVCQLSQVPLGRRMPINSVVIWPVSWAGSSTFQRKQSYPSKQRVGTLNFISFWWLIDDIVGKIPWRHRATFLLWLARSRECCSWKPGQHLTSRDDPTRTTHNLWDNTSLLSMFMHECGWPQLPAF